MRRNVIAYFVKLCLPGLISASRHFEGLYSQTKSLRQTNALQEAMNSSFNIIQKCGEELPLPMGNRKLENEMEAMNQVLRNTPDESLLNMVETNNTKVVILLKLYAELANIMFFVKPSLLGAVSLRMVHLTLKYGSTSECPLAFAFYSGTLVSIGNIDEACRLGEWDVCIFLLSFSNTYIEYSKLIFLCITPQEGLP